MTTLDDTESASPAGVRWWPLITIVVGAVLGIATLQWFNDHDRQMANIRSIMTGLLAGVLTVAWLFFFSRMPFRRRLLVGLPGISCLALFCAGFRIQGVTGDLVPIFEWRWQDDRRESARAPTGPAAVDAARRAATQPVAGLLDFPQFFGPERTGTLPGPRLHRDFNARAPEELWRRPVGDGWSGFVVAGRRAITHEQYGEHETVQCYDLLSGAVLWTHRDVARFASTIAGVGPRATPTVDGQRLFVQGATGILNCLDLKTGQVIWRKDILEDNGASLPEWGVAGSPLVLETRVVVNAGGREGRSLVAYDKTTGAFAWGGGAASAHWSSPVRATLAGVEQILIFNAGVTAHDSATGEVLWTYPWKQGHPHICMPVVCPGDRVLIASGYGTGCHLVQIAKTVANGEPGAFTATRLWRSLSLKAKFANIVTKAGFAYGLDDGILACVDLATGERRWKRGRYGHGQVLLVGDLLLATTEGGDVVLIEPSPEEARELTRFHIFDDKTWNPPALAGPYLLVRNHREAACFLLPVDDG